jgi:PKD repeat protein
MKKNTVLLIVAIVLGLLVTFGGVFLLKKFPQILQKNQQTASQVSVQPDENEVIAPIIISEGGLVDNGPDVITERLEEYTKTSNEPIHIVQGVSGGDEQATDDVEKYDASKRVKKRAVVNQAPIYVKGGIEFSGGYMVNSDQAVDGITLSSDGKMGDWHFGDGVTALGTTVEHSYGERGMYDVTFLAEESGVVYITQTKIVVGGVIPKFDTKNFTPRVNEIRNLKGSESKSLVGSITSYKWTCSEIQVEQCVFSAPTSARSAVQFTEPGIYEVSLTTTNNIGAREINRKIFTVSGEKPIAKIASIEPTNASHHPGEYSFDASESVNVLGQKTGLSYEWDFDGDGTWDKKITDPVVTHEYFTSGNKTVKLRVEHDYNRQDYLSEEITVVFENVNILWADFETPFVLAVEEPFLLHAESSEEVEYAWTIFPETYLFEEGFDIANANISFSEPGSYKITLTVTKDEDSASLTKTVPVRAKEAPMALVRISHDRSLSWEPATQNIPITRDERGMTNLFVKAHAVDETGKIGCDEANLNYSWSVSGVPISTDCDPGGLLNAQFTEAGTYLVDLVVYHPGNQNISDTTSFSVVIQNEPPIFIEPISYETTLGTDDLSTGPVSFVVTAQAKDSDTDNPIAQYFFEPMENGKVLSDTQLLDTGQAYFDLSQYDGIHTFFFRVTAFDVDGGRSLSEGIGTYTFQNNVQNGLPTITDFTASKSGVAKGESVRFDVMAQDPENETLSYQWTVFREGVTLFTAQTMETHFQYSFEEVGEHEVGVVVSDGMNTVSADTARTIYVRE